MAHLDNHLASLQTERDAAKRLRSVTVDVAINGNMGFADTTPWRETSLDEIAWINPRDKTLVPESPFITMADAQEWGLWARPSGPKGKRGGIRAVGGDTLFARITPCLENGKIAMVPTDLGPVGGSTEFIVLRAKEGVLPEFLFRWATSTSTHKTAIGLMTGTTGRQRVSSKDLGPLSVQIPPIPVQRQIVDLLNDIDAQASGLTEELNNLQAVRSGLLYGLISGTISVPDSYNSLLSEVA